MKHSSTQQVYDYWVSKRGRRSAPERSEIDPAAIRTALADTFILAYEPDEGHRFRLAGTRVCAIMGRELRDRSLLELFARPQRALAGRLIAPVIEDSTGFVAGVSGWTIDSLCIHLEMLLLPLRHHGAENARLLGVLAPLAPAPRWLGTRPVHELIAGPVRHLGTQAQPVRGADLHREAVLQCAMNLAGTTHAQPLVPALAPVTAEDAAVRRRNGFVVYDGGRA